MKTGGKVMYNKKYYIVDYFFNVMASGGLYSSIYLFLVLFDTTDWVAGLTHIGLLPRM